MSTSKLNPRFETLLEYIKHSRGFDLRAYKRAGLTRRLSKRMQEIEVESYTGYLDYLEVHPKEFVHLFNTLLINVTSFFRDHTVWEYLQSEIIPLIVSRKNPNEQIRIWSAGCASGEEAYSLAMVLAEVLGVEQCRERVKIYATDMDEEALHYARQATYQSRELRDITPKLLNKYFEANERQYVFHKDLRRLVIFGRHNLIQDAPISRIDLLMCRNTLMYFNSETQARIIARFHFAMKDGGFLALGRAEMLLNQTNTFTPVDLKQRIFTKVPDANSRDRLLFIS
ncbi:MAG: protein-glutamate O-methyltransferase CheR [Chroococcidiopsidaceae cyanobacterium CP_BM_RX_35]|nr:protein-glutamate O-methyltransferase CheR [Chroococcidiopsidaceae cyanobacterium CP_BM_RX_35]